MTKGVESASTLSDAESDADFAFPDHGKYEIQVQKYMPRLLSVQQRALDSQGTENLNGSGQQLLANASLKSKIDHARPSFSYLFEKGADIVQSIPKVVFNKGSPLSFTISSPQTLLEANLKLKNLGEQTITAAFSSTGKLSEAQLLNITHSDFISPFALSKYLEDGISPDEAFLLLPCIGLEGKEGPIPLCDPLTGNIHPDCLKCVKGSSRQRVLVFLDPGERLKLYILPEVNQVQENARQLFEQTKEIARGILNELKEPLNRLEEAQIQKFRSEICDACIDHKDLEALIGKLEIYFPENQKEAILQCKDKIRKKNSASFKKCNTFVQIADAENYFKVLEARKRLTEAIDEQENIKSNFNAHKDKILDFITVLLEKCELTELQSFKISWIVQGAVIKETMDITKTCAVARRVFCARDLMNSYTDTESNVEITAVRNREDGNSTAREELIDAAEGSAHILNTRIEDNLIDLVYFSTSNADSVASRWELLRQQTGLTDPELVEYLLTLYEGKTIPDELMSFLPFLMVLLLGKEPFYDLASIPANFIMLYSVKLGINSFEDALHRMPLIPQGAIAAKQFLLNVGDTELDSWASVQYKGNSHIPKSVFLSSLGAFLGPAADWITKYDVVVKTALECCQVLFFENRPLDDEDQLWLHELDTIMGKKGASSDDMHDALDPTKATEPLRRWAVDCILDKHPLKTTIQYKNSLTIYRGEIA